MSTTTRRHPWRAATAALALACLLGCGCATAPKEAATPGAAQAVDPRAGGTHEGDHTTRQVEVFREGPTDEHATLRFYDDMPNVAYINVCDYYRLLMPQGQMDATRQDDGTWRVETHTGASPDAAMERGLGGTAVVDPARGTLFSADFSAFANTMSRRQLGMDNLYLDGMGLVRVAGADYDREAAPAVIDLSAYGIAVRDGGDGLWMPVHTLSTFFTNLHYDYVLFNGKKLYVNDENDLRPLTERDEDFATGLFYGEERPDDMVAFDYAQLRLAFDVFYGRPACASEALKTQGLEAHLDALGEGGRAVREALLAKDYAMYLHGCDGLSSTLNKDGHTMIDVVQTSGLSESEAHKGLYERYQKLGKDEGDPINRLIKAHAEEMAPIDTIQLTCKELSHKAFGDQTYVKRGDTAVIVLDSVDDVDIKGWRAFLAGTGPRPSGSEPIADESSTSKGNVDSIALFLDALDKAKADPEVKNVVLDVSKNDGGSDDVVMFITSLVARRERERFENTITGQTITERFDVDRNLDGRFDEADDAVDYSDLNFAVLTSGYSYSCGNQLPCLMRDAGVPIIGERSGGGSCSLQRDLTGEGLVYSHSSWISRLVNDAGEEIDDGVPVDVDLLERAGSRKERRVAEFGGKRVETELHDYSSFYDLDNLSQVMNEIYATRQTG